MPGSGSKPSADHLDFVEALGGNQVGEVVPDVARPFGRDQRVDIAPFLRPHIAEQIGADRAGGGLHIIAVFLVELAADIGVQRHVERLHFLPHAFGLAGELVGVHVVVRTPHRAEVGKAEFLRAFVGDRDHALVILAHGCTDIVVPAGPHFGEFFGRALEIAHLGLDIAAVDFLAIERARALAIGRAELGGDFVEFGCRAVADWRGHDDAVAQDIELARDFGIEPRNARILRRFIGICHRFLGRLRAVFRCQLVAVMDDIGVVEPQHPAVFDREIEHVLLDHRDPVGGALRRHRIGGYGRFGCLRMMIGHGRGGERDGKRGERDGCEFHAGPLRIGMMWFHVLPDCTCRAA